MTTPTGKAPCARVCEAQAFTIELRHRDSRIKELEAEVNVWKEAEEVSYAYIKKTNAALDVALEALKWLDRWMGNKPLLECANKVRAAIAKLKEVRK